MTKTIHTQRYLTDNKEYSISSLLASCFRCQQNEKKQKITKAYKFLISNTSDSNIIRHSLEVASVIGGEIGLGATSVTAALLHELPRYTDITLEDIKNEFGPEIFQILEGLYKIKNTELQFKKRDIENADLYRQIIFNMARDLRIIYLRIAERLTSLRHFDQLNQIQKDVIPSETLKIYAPIADALGSFKIKSELEDRSFRYLNPTEYSKILQYIESNKLKEWYFLNKVSLPIIKELFSKGIKFTMQSRQKSIYSIYQKAIRKNIPYSQVFDIFAIRIILFSDPELNKDQRLEQEKVLCEQTSNIIEKIYEIHPGRIRDWLHTPKQPSGYMAKHITIKEPKTNRWVEIQIRGEAMNEIAEFGYAAHWKYKGVKAGLDKFAEELKQITNKLENIEEDVESLLSLIDPFVRLDKIHVYTPDLDEITLTKGATVLDFAAKIHTDLVKHFGGAIINNSKTVSATYELQNGDIVKIIKTNSLLRPQKEWLQKVISTDARKELQKILNIKNIRQEGFVTLLNIANKNDITIDNKVIRALLQKFKLENKDILYNKIASGEISEEQVENVISKFRKTKFFKFVIKNSDKYKELKNNFILATCCNPTPNDNIVAVKEDGIYHIHKTTCENLNRKIDNSELYKIIPLEWQQFKTQALSRTIQIKTNSRIDYLMKLTQLLYSFSKVEIQELTMNKNDADETLNIKISLTVLNNKEFQTMIKQIEKINGTIKVEVI